MHFRQAFFLLAASSSANAFTFSKNTLRVNNGHVQRAVSAPEKVETERKGPPIYDPLGLYPESSDERRSGRVQAMEPKLEVSKPVRDPMGLYPNDSEEYAAAVDFEKESFVTKNSELYDPLGLYPVSSEERTNSKIKPLEQQMNVPKPIVDPMGLYSNESSATEVDKNADMSMALPFLPRPEVLDGELAGDVGFDPLGFAKNRDDLVFLRDAELKHSRIAMLAAAGWPLSELWDKQLAALAHMKPLLVDGDRVPSILNGGLTHVNPFYWFGVLAIAGLAEGLTQVRGDKSKFDPLGFFPEDKEGQKKMELAEIKNGRLAMLAITGFAFQEALTKLAVVQETPFFFHPPF